MTRTINVTSTAVPAVGKTISSTTYRLLAADGVTVISTAGPPYVGVTDLALKLEQTVTQSDAQVAIITHDIPGRVTDLAATNAAAPILSWTDVGGETSYEIHRGAAGFTPDVVGHTSRIGTAIQNAGTYTDSSVAGNGATVFAYRVVAITPFGYTIGNEATCTPVAAGIGTTYADTFTGAFAHPLPLLMSDGAHSWTIVGGADPYRDGAGNISAWSDFSKPAGLIIVTDSPNQAITTTWAAISSSVPGIFLRYTDSTHYLRVGYLDAGSGTRTIKLWKNVGAGEVLVATSGIFTPAPNDVMFASVDAANLITVKLNGTNLFAPVTDAANATAQGAGISGDFNSGTALSDWTCVTS